MASPWRMFINEADEYVMINMDYVVGVQICMEKLQLTFTDASMTLVSIVDVDFEPLIP